MATMFVTDEMIKRAKELADELFYDFECIGIRVQDGIPFELGNLDHTSKVWDNGEETNIDLDGVCIIGINDIENIKAYYGDHAAVVVGDTCEYGEDQGELVIKNAQVIEILA